MGIIVVGVDPGAKDTGVCVVRGREVLASHTVTTVGELFPADRDYLQAVVAAVRSCFTPGFTDFVDFADEPTLVAVETITKPNWHMGRGGAAANPTALLATAQVLGAVLAHPWPVPIVTVQPDKNGSQPLGAYPPDLVSAAERRAKNWQLKVGGGQLRHQRSAFDAARTAVRNHQPHLNHLLEEA
ncbi:hypothetical protein ACFRFQ_17775 [Rhodococcus sp. NPDC056743]|uniref:hypothetical protein n=1 Tax=Rhodococcus sp. NPDC056743 TaxID=3345934 RepID=UPI00366ED124